MVLEIGSQGSLWRRYLHSLSWGSFCCLYAFMLCMLLLLAGAPWAQFRPPAAMCLLYYMRRDVLCRAVCAVLCRPSPPAGAPWTRFWPPCQALSLKCCRQQTRVGRQWSRGTAASCQVRRLPRFPFFISASLDLQPDIMSTPIPFSLPFTSGFQGLAAALKHPLLSSTPILHIAAHQSAFPPHPSTPTPAAAHAGDKRRTVMVLFIGGVTYAEVSALRFLSSKGLVNADFVVGTTKMVNGSTLLGSLVVKSAGEKAAAAPGTE